MKVALKVNHQRAARYGRLLAVMALVWLAGCTAAAPAETVIPPTKTAMPPAQPRGLEKTAAVAPYCDEVADAEICPVKPPVGDGIYPAPDLLDETGLPAAAFQDCARTPGLPGCGAEVAALAARLAFFEGDSSRLMVLDLLSGEGRQVALENAPRRLEWSADGFALLVEIGPDSYAVFDRQARFDRVFNSEALPRWQPNSQINQDGLVSSSDGWLAELRSEDGSAWNLHVWNQQAAERVLPVSGGPPDTLYSLRGWIPNTLKVLVQIYTAGNAAMLSGGQLALLDAQDGVLTPLNITARLDDSVVAWEQAAGDHPRLAVLSGGQPEGASGIALYDFASQETRELLPVGAVINDLAWSADGSGLYFAVAGLAADASPEARKAFSGVGIYRVEAQEGAITRVTAPPPGAQDGWPQLTADGRALVYARVLPELSGAGKIQVRARLLENGQEWVLVEGLPAAETVAGRVIWNRFIAYTDR